VDWCDETSRRVDHENTCSRAIRNQRFPRRLVSLLSSERRANDLIREQWLSINNLSLSELVLAHAVYQLTKPLRRVDVLRRRAAMAVVVAAAKLFENSAGVSTAAFSRLD